VTLQVLNYKMRLAVCWAVVRRMTCANGAMQTWVTSNLALPPSPPMWCKWEGKGILGYLRQRGDWDDVLVTFVGFHENEGGRWRANGEDEGNSILSDRAATVKDETVQVFSSFEKVDP
jgi:hypothetical protein